MRSQLEACIHAVNHIILGKEQAVRLAMACLLARGHLLIEDLPGMGKTTLSHALAQVLGLSYQRIQFTSDLLPGDILGTSVFDRETGQFVFIRGLCSPNCYWLMKSIARHRKAKALCLKPWKKGK